jgi:GNAT superfamily N-acetyltransferase
MTTSISEKLSIRPFEYSDEDYGEVVSIANTLWPDEPTCAESLRYYDGIRNPKYDFERILGEVDGNVVVSALYGQPWWSYAPGKYFIYINVHPDWHRKGIGSKIYDHIVGVLAAKKPSMYTSDTRADKPDYIRFLTSRGYKEVMRVNVSRLDLSEFDWDRYAWTEERLDEIGVKILSARELEANDPDWKRKSWDLWWELFQDVPMPDPPSRLPYEQHEKRLESPGFFPECYLVAMDGDKWVGASALWRSLADKETLGTGLTGVVRSHRRKKIATALKVRTFKIARDRGFRNVDTDNEENNPMYDLNVELGFKPRPQWIIFKKMLGEDDST